MVTLAWFKHVVDYIFGREKVCSSRHHFHLFPGHDSAEQKVKVLWDKGLKHFTKLSFQNVGLHVLDQEEIKGFTSKYFNQSLD